MIGKEKVFSTIPCQQMSGYTEKGKYICNSDRELQRMNRKKCRKYVDVDINLE